MMMIYIIKDGMSCLVFVFYDIGRIINVDNDYFVD